MSALEARVAADHEDNELDPRLLVSQLPPRGASEFERRERAKVLEISAVDHRTVFVSEITSWRDVSKARAVVSGRARPHVLAQHMQRVQAVDEHVAFDMDMAGD